MLFSLRTRDFNVLIRAVRLFYLADQIPLCFKKSLFINLQISGPNIAVFDDRPDVIAEEELLTKNKLIIVVQLTRDEIIQQFFPFRAVQDLRILVIDPSLVVLPSGNKKNPQQLNGRGKNIADLFV